MIVHGKLLTELPFLLSVCLSHHRGSSSGVNHEMVNFKNSGGYDCANLHLQVNVYFRYVPFCYEHLGSQWYQSWKAPELRIIVAAR